MRTIHDPRELAELEQELLRAAAASGGQLHLETRCETRGWAVRAGKRKFYDPADPELASRYVAEIPQLVQFQLIREFETKNCYELTNIGWQLVRKLEQRARE